MSAAFDVPRGSENGNRFSPSGVELLTGVTQQMLPLNALEPHHLDIRDIAYGLANQRRFNGHNPLQPNIAAHSLAVGYISNTLLLGSRDWPKPVLGEQALLRRAALMHDAAEAYVGDLSGAVKKIMRLLGPSPFDVLEDRIQTLIHEHWDCAPVNAEHAQLLHDADCLACAYEMAATDGWCGDPKLAELPEWLTDSTYLRSTYQLNAEHAAAVFVGSAARLGIR